MSTKEEQTQEPLLQKQIDDDQEVKNQEQPQPLDHHNNHTWIIYSLLAAFFCTICNVLISDISLLGIDALIYLAPGTWISALFFFFGYAIYNKRNTGKCVVNLNLTEEKSWKPKWNNIGGFFIFGLIYICKQTIVVYTFEYSNLANLNVGIVSTIWATTPLFGALLDFLVFGVKMTTKHVIGVACLIGCVICISLTSVITDNSINLEEATVQPWIPVLISLVAPIGFATSNLQSKILVQRNGFNATRLSLSAFGTVGLFLSVFLFYIDNFSWKYLIEGTVGSIINTIGLVFIYEACSNGPIGPATALININTLLFTLVEAIKHQKMPHTLEFFGFFIGFFGALVLSIPNQMLYLYKVLTCQKNKLT